MLTEAEQLRKLHSAAAELKELYRDLFCEVRYINYVP